MPQGVTGACDNAIDAIGAPGSAIGGSGERLVRGSRHERRTKPKRSLKDEQEKGNYGFQTTQSEGPFRRERVH